MKRLFVLVASLLLIATASFATQIKIGALVSITGPTSFLGQPEKNTLEMLAEQINKNGGINGNKIKLIVYDTKGEPAQTVVLARKLIYSDRVLAIIGPTRSGSTLAIIPLIERARVPLISMASSYKITTPTKKWVFKTAPSDSLAVERLYSYLQDKNISKIAILTAETGFGESGREELKKLASKYNIEILADETFAATDTNMTPQLIKIKNIKGVEAIVCWGTNPGPASVAKNAKELGIKIPLFMSHGVASKRFIQLAGNAAEGIILPVGKLVVAEQLPKTDPQKAVLLSYKNSYEKNFGPVSTFGGHAYDAFMMLKKALQNKAKTKSQIRDELEKIKHFVGITGVFSYSKKDHAGLDPSDFCIVKIENGNWKLIAY
ncbi:ABC transporter substrate-binding protein [Hippea maritima]|uniref:Extracellular ligand-binding receptor n=1 Tax=Hippea maritima (strain ATCC 700847 / DSM 10411 / MH2) TaxID=760142 RepID=F2LWX3_HIPMA|nr:ABC transporter substrate-binding protein [Hippea maritima]AEA34157.1 Extracellular ligand-binding receptor [Hippea maritima DSM 10411]